MTGGFNQKDRHRIIFRPRGVKVIGFEFVHAALVDDILNNRGTVDQLYDHFLFMAEFAGACLGLPLAFQHDALEQGVETFSLSIMELLAENPENELFEHLIEPNLAFIDHLFDTEIEFNPLIHCTRPVAVAHELKSTLASRGYRNPNPHFSPAFVAKRLAA